MEATVESKKLVGILAGSNSLNGSVGSVVSRDSKLATRLASVTIYASKWVTESENLHAQVVTIDGTTQYSKVDLLPSAEQLIVFHNKDVSFVTENEDGVVTVYAIGDKPVLDYTMQVQITEVLV